MRIFGRIKAGLAIGAQKNLASNLNKVFEILERIEGVGGITISKKGTDWRIANGGTDGGGPDGGEKPEDPCDDHPDGGDGVPIDSSVGSPGWGGAGGGGAPIGGDEGPGLCVGSVPT